MKARQGFPSFRGPFKTFSISVHSNREKSLDNRLLVFSQGSRAKVVKFLWLKYLWDELSKMEMELFLTFPEVLNSEIIVSALRAVLVIGKRKVRERLINCPFLNDEDKPTKIKYQGFKRLDVEITRITRSLPRVKKFSGWIRSSSAKGSKRGTQRSEVIEPLAVIDNDYEDEIFNWYSYLSSSEYTISTQWL